MGRARGNVTIAPSESLYADVVGQDSAVAQLRAAATAPVHAYLLVGPAGTGKLAAARSLAAGLLCEQGGCGACEHCRRALAGTHPDLVVVQRQGASMQVADAAAVTRMSIRSPLEARRKVIVLDELHLVDRAGPALLKTIEEPPTTTVFIAIAEQVPEELVTIASRCVRIDFGPVATSAIEAALVAEGATEEVAAAAAAAALGRIDRARLLVSDAAIASRLDAWRDVPAALDGTGATVARVVDDLRAMFDRVEDGLLAERHRFELAELAARRKMFGERGSGASELEDRHRREKRRVRTDELRLGLATLADFYRRRLSGPVAQARDAVDALGVLGDAAEALIRNPNEQLLLQALLLSLPRQ